MTSIINGSSSEDLLPSQELEGKVYEGKDGRLYIVKKNKKGIYSWQPILEKKTPEEYYKQFPTYIKPKHKTTGISACFIELARKLKSRKITVAVIPWNKYDPIIEIDEWFRETQTVGNYLLYSDNKLFWDARRSEGYMSIYHDIDDNLLPIVNAELKRIFPDRTNGITSRNDALKIYFTKKKNIPIDVEKIRYSVDFTFDKKINTPAVPIIDKLNICLHKIGYVDSYDMLIKNGKLNVYCNINFDRISEFKRAIIDIKKKVLPQFKIKKIDYTKISD
jgi:hypothetical protein